ncbi:hypothetical protein GQ53DRAFT_752348 [Thozetella sp. PMI_491]|nr:hypothetical protein GQ53DRAFT_752348 [Thozetella sp. PMI_491]
MAAGFSNALFAAVTAQEGRCIEPSAGLPGLRSQGPDPAHLGAVGQSRQQGRLLPSASRIKSSEISWLCTK